MLWRHYSTKSSLTFIHSPSHSLSSLLLKLNNLQTVHEIDVLKIGPKRLAHADRP